MIAPRSLAAGRGAVPRRRFLRAAGLAAAGAASLGATWRRSPYRVVVWTSGGDDAFTTWLNNQVVQFQKDTPYIQVTVTGSTSDHPANDLRLALAANAPLDVCVMDAALLPGFAATGDLVNLGNFPDFPLVASLYIPGYLDAMTYRGRIYGLPLNAQPYVLLGNRTLLGRVPLPRTWAEFVRAVRVSTTGGNYGYAFPGGGGSDTADHFAAWLLAGGGRIVSPEGDEPLFNGPAGVGALEMLVELARANAIPVEAVTGTIRDSLGSFVRGEAAFDCDGPIVQTIMNRYGAGTQDLEIGPMPVATPPLEPNPPASLVTLQAMAMLSSTRSSSAAWALLRYLRAAKADLEFTSGAMGGLPVVKVAYAGGVRWGMLGKDAYRLAADSVGTWPAVNAIGVVQTAMAGAVAAALGNGTPPRRALDTAARLAALALAPPLRRKVRPRR